jgi:hypothetical protein
MKQDHTVSRFAQLGARSHLPYEVRLERFNLLHAMRNGLAPYDRRFSLRQAADEMVRLGYERTSRERVRQLLAQGPPLHRGNNGAVFACDRKELERRIELWESRRTKKGDARASAYRLELDELDRAPR